MRGTGKAARPALEQLRCIPAHAGNGPGFEVSVEGETGASPRMRGTGRRAPWPAADRRCIPAHAGNGVHRQRLCGVAAVHPRACGERSGMPSRRVCRCGASPRMRGTVIQLSRFDELIRCIPAHAGNGISSRSADLSKSVHPRACGERDWRVKRTPTRGGASPRMRGTGRAGHCARGTHRCIPAHAGNGPPVLSRAWSLSVHPRACGERLAGFRAILSPAGASPRMRGTALLLRLELPQVRCIPAHAGNGPSTKASMPPTAVHPRACGERPTRICSMRPTSGASPRMRGTGTGTRPDPARCRCIPAHAGNGRLFTDNSSGESVHPRACGERDSERDQFTALGGASPRMRGTDSGAVSGPDPGRCIPAHAGNGARTPAAVSAPTVHPRACGERRSRAEPKHVADGASPRMRGTAAVLRR